MDALLRETHAAERRHFWYSGFHGFVRPLLAAAVRGDRSRRVLDAGCGTGANLGLLAEFGVACGIDVTLSGLLLGRRGGTRRVACATACRLPFPAGVFDVVTSFDVLYCLEDADERAAIAEMFGVLRPGGGAVVSVPAFLAWWRARREGVPLACGTPRESRAGSGGRSGRERERLSSIRKHADYIEVARNLSAWIAGSSTFLVAARLVVLTDMWNPFDDRLMADYGGFVRGLLAGRPGDPGSPRESFRHVADLADGMVFRFVSCDSNLSEAVWPSASSRAGGESAPHRVAARIAEAPRASDIDVVNTHRRSPRRILTAGSAGGTLRAR